MQYRQITSEERYAIAALRRQGLSVAGDRPRPRAGRPRRSAARWRATAAPTAATAPSPPASARSARRRRSRRNSHFGAAGVGAGRGAHRARLEPRAGRRLAARCTSCSRSATRPSTCYVWRDKHAGGELWRHMRQAGKKRRKRYGAYDSRGRLAGKRHISERPAEVEGRRRRRPLGDRHGEGRRPGPAQRGHPGRAQDRLPRDRQARASLRRRRDRAHHRADRPPPGRVRTVTADNGTEFHSYAEIEAATGALLLLRDPAPLLGAGHEREHQRPAAPVPAEAAEHGARHAGRLRRDRREAQRAAAEAARLQDPGGVLCTSQVGESVRSAGVALQT